jgi:hypothetical protein
MCHLKYIIETITIVTMHVPFRIHCRNNLIDKKDSYSIPRPPSWDDRNCSYIHQLYPSDCDMLLLLILNFGVSRLRPYRHRDIHLYIRMNQYITLMLNPKYKCISVHCLYEHDFLRDPFSKSIQHITITRVKLH